MFFLRRGLVGGNWARAWVALDQGGTTYVVSGSVGGSFADPTAYVGALSGATHGYAALGSSSLSPSATATIIAAAFTSLGVTGVSTDGATIIVSGASNLVIPPAVDLTDTSLRGMLGGQRDDWGDGGAGQNLNGDGGTGGTGSVHIGQLGTAGRILAVYVWTRTDTVGMVGRLAASTGPVYSASPGEMTLLMEGVDTIQGFGAIVDEATPVASDDEIWAQYASDTATAGIRFRAHGLTPVGRGDQGLNQVLVWDTTRSASSATAFGETYTPTADATFNIYVMIGVVFEVPDGSGNYHADAGLTLRVGDQNDDPDHGTAFDVVPAIIDGETTHHRQGALPLSSIGITSISRTIGDTDAGEDSRAMLYEWDDLNFPSTTPATLVSDAGPMGFTAGSGNRLFTLTLGSRIEIGTEALTEPYWSLGFNYCTDDGAALVTMVLPVFLDDAAGDSGWLDCWEDDRGTWHDDIRGASEYAQPAGITEYRTRFAAGNTGMPTTDIDDAAPVTMSTDASDDSPSAIAIDWVIIERVGIVSAALPSEELTAAVTASGDWSMASTGVSPIASDVDVSGAWSMSSVAVYGLASDVAVSGAWSMASDGIPSIVGIVGGVGEALTIRALGTDAYGLLRPQVGDGRPIRFELVGVDGVDVPHVAIESIEANVRRASDPVSLAATVVPTEESVTGSDSLTYSWAVDLTDEITIGGQWILEFDVVMLDGVAVTWPSPAPQFLMVTEGVD